MIGHKIAQLRRSSGMSQAELASRLHISPSTVGMYEQGRREPSIETLVALSHIFGVTVDAIVSGGASGMLPVAAEKSQVLRILTREELAVWLLMLLLDRPAQPEMRPDPQQSLNQG
ncbi:MAG: helix-turn-helix domain-containing protein [Firmicutes bacterium]|nr:helix-turn-helix domain-containing protein [Bacillota bacterium]